ncbi:hypothetical protein HK099_003611 [Clydaea vesicula]|uniref:Mitochondrial ATPase inhibitor n=1 Tax=Clydaea vesicula TaxID=447962 RepID=A0AAD5U1T6_9FUNG|nr:hypothetical protein HK099_003611 [Clydaea vesicula]KAJ3385224.1 hypothetical protein HDU92_003156 [Lobulomyces angularis]
MNKFQLVKRLPALMRPTVLRSYSNIRDSKGALSDKEKAAEDYYINQHELELKKKLRAAASEKKPSTAEVLKEYERGETLSTEDHIRPSSGVSGSSLNKREAAAEEKYIYEHEKELRKKLQEKK